MVIFCNLCYNFTLREHFLQYVKTFTPGDINLGAIQAAMRERFD